MLKRLSDARAAGDRVLAVIRGSAVNQDGASSGLTVPNGPAQQAVMRQALAAAGVAPADVDYVEAHGTGTALGDPIELEALDAVLSEGRPADRPLVVGSVKTNIGHCESAVGRRRSHQGRARAPARGDPAAPAFRDADPARSRCGSRRSCRPRRDRGARGERAATGRRELVRLQRHERARRARGAAAGRAARAVRPATARVVTLSAKTPAAVRELAARYARHLSAHPETTLADLSQHDDARSRRSSRTGWPSPPRAWPTRGRALAAAATGAAAPGVLTSHVTSGGRPGVAFLFPGQGSQWPAMARRAGRRRAGRPPRAGVVRRRAARRRSTSRCSSCSSARTSCDETQYTQPALFAVEWALAALWRAWGVEPAVVIGHSVGEYAAACVAGVMDLDDALRLIAARGRLMPERTARGAMAAVFADETTVAAAVARMRARSPWPP